MSIDLAAMQIQNWAGGGSVAYVQYSFDIYMTDVNDVEYGPYPTFFKEAECTVVGETLTTPYFADFPTTTDAKVGAEARCTARLFDENHTEQGFLFINQVIYQGLTEPVQLGQLQLWNATTHYFPRPNEVWTANQIIAWFNTQPPAVKASYLLYGITALSKAPDSLASPIAWGVNDEALGYYASKISSLSSFISGIGSTPTRLYVDTDIVSNTITLPATLQIIPAGGIIRANSGQTITCLSSIYPIPIWIFRGPGTISFAGNNNIPAYFAEWLGAVGDGVTDDGPVFNRLQIAKPYDAPIIPLPYRTYGASTIDNNGTPLVVKGPGIVGSSDDPSTPKFKFLGPSGEAVFNCHGTNYIDLEGFAIIAKNGGHEADYGIKIDNAAGVGPEAKIILNHLFINFPGVRSTFVGLDLSEVATANLENISVKNTKIFAGSDESTSNPSRGKCVRMGANANSIAVTFEHVWLRAASVGLDTHGGNMVAFRDGFITACDVAAATASDVEFDNVRFENVQGYYTNNGGDQHVTFHKCFLDLYGLSPAIPAFDLAAGNTLLEMVNNSCQGVCDAAQVFFDASGGGGQSRLFSRLNNYPTTSNLGLGGFAVVDAGEDFGLAQDSFVRASMTGPIDRHADPASSPDPLPKTQIVGATIYTRHGQMAEDGNWLTNIYEDSGTFSKDNALKGGWRVQQLPAATLDTSNHYRISYYPIGSVTPTIVFDLDGSGKVTLGALISTSINKVAITAPATAATLTIANNKTLTVNSTITLIGTDGRFYTFPSTNATLARTDAAQTINGNQTFLDLVINTEGAALTVSGNTIAPTDQIHQVGAGLIKTITVPAGFTSGTIALIPTAAFTYDNTSNVLGTGTAVIGRTMYATYSSSTSKWSMSY